MFYIVSQNKEKIYNMNGNVEGMGYKEVHDCKYKKGGEKEETTRHTICIYNGCAEEVAEYEAKEDCIKILRVITFGIRNGENNVVCELPTQEELQKMWQEIEQLEVMLKDATGNIQENLKELLKALKN